ncbi:MAG: DUF547 domain-containing protein [Deltaproteobacteria bacterium]|nr:DUF547 domain-containing protein [Deltaproteobacteria bacterium]
MKTLIKKIYVPFFVITCFFNQHALAFDHSHSDWDRLLKKHVVVTRKGSTSWVHYADFQKDNKTLENYTESLSAVTLKEFESWSKSRQLAFLINAYNAFTIELILTRYPDIDSIWDTGSFIVKPWRKKFFTLLGQKRHLDEIEHNMIRKKGVYDDARIHFAVNCASIGCPALRNEAFVYDQLDKQLEDSLVGFLSDASRNRFNSKTNTLEVSKVFDWYKKDFSQNDSKSGSLEAFFAAYAYLFSSQPEALKRIREMSVNITFLKYDWNLNDIKK